MGALKDFWDALTEDSKKAVKEERNRSESVVSAAAKALKSKTDRLKEVMEGFDGNDEEVK